MKFCAQCGAANEDDMFSCYSCGAMLETPQTNTGKGRGLSIPKPLLLIGGIVAAVAVVVGGIVFAVSGTGGRVENAMDQTLEEFGGNQKERTQAGQFFAAVSDRLSKGEYTMYASFSGDSVDLQMNTDYSRAKKTLRGDLNLAGYGVEYSVKKDIMQFRFPGEYEVYGLDVKEINKFLKKINDSLFAPVLKDLLPETNKLPTDLNVDFFKKTDLKKTVEDIAGKELKEFRKNLKVEKWNSETIVRAGKTEKCRVYKVSWKSADLTKLLSTIGSGGLLPDLGDWLNSLIPEMDPYLFCYVNRDDYIVCVEFTTAGTKCRLTLEGEENLWDKVILTTEALNGAVNTYEGALDRRGDVFELYLKNAYGEKPFVIYYDDDNGYFSAWVDTIGTLAEGRITCERGTASITVYWDTAEFGQQELFFSIGELKNKPEQLGEKYTDLKKIGWQIAGNMINDMLTN